MTPKRRRVPPPRQAPRRRGSSRVTKRPAREAVPARGRALKPEAKCLPWLWPVLGLVLGLILLWAPFAPFVTPKPTRVWRGYYTLLARAGGPADSRLGAALARLGPGVVSADTTTVDIYDFSSVVRFRLAELSSRLDPLDPRRDPYIDRMGGYFSVPTSDADFHVVYIPARRSALAIFLSLTGALGPSRRAGWRLVELDPVEKIVGAISVIACASLGALAPWRRRRGSLSVAVAGALLWIPAILASGPATLSISLLLLFFWVPLAQRRLASAPRGANPRRVSLPLFLYTAVGAGSTAVFSLLKGSALGDSMQPAAPFLCSLLLLVLAPRLRAVARSCGSTPAFSSVPLLRPLKDDGRGTQRVLLLALLCIAIAVLIPLGRGGALPAPLPLLGTRGFSWDAVARLQKKARADGLPDFSDLVAHEAYQQTAGFGRAWQSPVRDERVYGVDYLVDPKSGVVSARPRTLARFDSSWLARVASRPPSGSLEALLLAQDRPASVAVRGPARSLARELPFAALAFSVLLALLCRDLRLGLLIRGNLWRLMGEARRDQIP